MDSKFCYLATLIVGVILAVWGFFDVLKEKQPREADSKVLQRQLRGFGFLVLSQVVLIVGVSLCFGASVGVDRIAGGIEGLFS